MALTKHQKLARGLKALLAALDEHHEKAASMLNALQMHFYETHLILGRRVITEQALKVMMNTHRCALCLFAPNEELRTAARSSPSISFTFTPKLYPPSKILEYPPDAPKDEKQVIPWGVKIFLPSQSLLNLSQAKEEALLYCASKNEMSEWIDWFEEEDIAHTLTNQIAAMIAPVDKLSSLEENLNKPAFSPFYETALKYYKKNPPPNILNATFAPDEGSTIAEAYARLSKSTRSHEKDDFKGLQRAWRDQLEQCIFADMKLSQEEKQTILEERFPLKRNRSKKNPPNPRWQTSLAVDRQTYATFIRYFAELFLKNPQQCQTDAEITLLLWVMVYISRDPNHIIPIKRLLCLTTADVIDQIINIDGHEVDISMGLAGLFNEYTGGAKSQRQQKLFPNLNIDKLEDYFRRASSELLPPNSLPALPEAFLTFPHARKHIRIPAPIRHQQQKHPQQIHHNLISRHELKRQLIDISKSQAS